MKASTIKTLLWSGAAVAVLSLSSCKDFLYDPPTDYIPEEESITTAARAQEVLNASYNALRGGNFLGGNVQVINELMADHLRGDIGEPNTNGDWRPHFTRTTDNFLGTTRNVMTNAGQVVGRGNQLLRYIDEIADLTEAERTRMKAEVRFLKAVSRFEVVRMFAQPYGFTADNSHDGIALYESFSLEPLNRSTVAETYNAITRDLRIAANDLPGTNGVYATSWAAKAYLAKVYFQMNNFDSAYYFANDVIANSPFAFDNDLSKRFSQSGSTETIFWLASTSINDNSGGNFRTWFLLDPGTFNGKIFPSETFKGKIEANPDDVRYTTWFVEGQFGQYPVLNVTKFATSTEIQVTLAHITEMYLIRAESAAELGANLSQAAADLSLIRERAGYGVGSVPGSTSATQLIQIARDERELEMFFEGNRLHELKRQAVRGNTGLLIRGAIWNCPGMVCQIPDNELSGNLNYTPNEQGGCN